MGLSFISNGKRCGIIELIHEFKVLQRANSCNSKFFRLVRPFVLWFLGIFFFFRFHKCSLSGCIYLRVTLTASNLDFQCFFFFLLILIQVKGSICHNDAKNDNERKKDSVSRFMCRSLGNTLLLHFLTERYLKIHISALKDLS